MGTTSRACRRTRTTRSTKRASRFWRPTSAPKKKATCKTWPPTWPTEALRLALARTRPCRSEEWGGALACAGEKGSSGFHGGALFVSCLFMLFMLLLLLFLPHCCACFSCDCDCVPEACCGRGGWVGCCVVVWWWC